MKKHNLFVYDELLTKETQLAILGKAHNGAGMVLTGYELTNQHTIEENDDETVVGKVFKVDDDDLRRVKRYKEGFDETYIVRNGFTIVVFVKEEK